MPYKDKAVKKARHKEYHKSWYQRNKERHKENCKKNRQRYFTEWKEFKCSQKCAHCGFSHPAVIDFHHIDPKPDDRKVNELTSNGQYTAAMQEIRDRCIALCSNCHRILHWDENHDKSTGDSVSIQTLAPQDKGLFGE